MKRILKSMILLIIGGIIYSLLEVTFRGGTHWSMVLVGGICFLAVGYINEDIPWEMPLPLQMLIGMLIITFIEFYSGLIINVSLRWNVWDYSNMPLNLFGQICLPFCALWYIVSLVAIVLDDYLRYWLFGEDKPVYRIL